MKSALYKIETVNGSTFMPHDHSHHHCHGDPSEMGERRLLRAIAANMLLTVGQVAGGIVSGSLSLIADALHNFSDAAALLIALFAIRIGRRPPDQFKTFGYKRAETIAALINLTVLVVIGLYLVIEAVGRFITPEPISGWLVIWVAGLALVVDVYTAILTYRQSKTSMNMRAAFLHNLTDAMASVGVIVSGTLILLFGWVWTDAVMTLLISFYVLWHGFGQMPKVIHLLMEGTPHDIEIETVIEELEKITGVDNAHHVHIWQIDEYRNALEAHIVLEEGIDMDRLKRRAKEVLKEQFNIDHSTLEFENIACHPKGVVDD